MNQRRFEEYRSKVTDTIDRLKRLQIYDYTSIGPKTKPLVYNDENGYQRVGPNVTPRIISNSYPYYDNQMITRAIRSSTEPDRVGRWDHVADREPKNIDGVCKPMEGSSKKAASALLNHYYKIENRLLVSPEQERWIPTYIAHETNHGKPDLIVETFNPFTTERNMFSDLIICEVKKSEPSTTYRENLWQLRQYCDSRITTRNEQRNVFACLISGRRVSFFNAYDFAQPIPYGIFDLIPIYPQQISKQELTDVMKVKLQYTKHGQDNSYLIGCEFDLLENQSKHYVHQCFLNMSGHSGPRDPILDLNTIMRNMLQEQDEPEDFLESMRNYYLSYDIARTYDDMD